MTTFPALKRCLAAGLTLFVIGAPVAYWLQRGGNQGLEPAAHAAQAKAASQDWTMYGGTPSRNMVNTSAKDIPKEWDVDTMKNIKWAASLGSKAYGGPIIAGGRVFIGTNNQNPRDKKWNFIDPKTKKLVDLGVVMCFDEGKGNFLWQSVFEKLPGGQVIDWPLEGICSSPHVEGDYLYFVSNRCEVVCANVKTGENVWKLDMIKELNVFPHNISDCSPLLIGDHLWVVTSNGVNEDHLNVPEPNAPSFIKVEKKSGKVVWQNKSPTEALLAVKEGDTKDFFKELVNRGRLVQHGQWANASYGVVNGQPQVIFPGGDGWIRAFSPEGELIWKFDCNPKNAKYALKTGERSDFIATPTVYKNRVYIGVGQDPEHKFGIGHFWCIDMTKKGDVSPELVTDEAVFPPKTKPNPNSAKLWHYGGVIADPAEVKKLKRNYYFGRTMSTCAIHDDLVYISELNGRLHCLDANTGQVYWEHHTGNEIWSSPYYADNKVYLGNDDGTVFVFQHGKQKKLLEENAMGGRVRATPTVANGVLYVLTENKLYAIAEKK
jgi:outer membrane protein assembly factor BamB